MKILNKIRCLIGFHPERIIRKDIVADGKGAIVYCGYTYQCDVCGREEIWFAGDWSKRTKEVPV